MRLTSANLSTQYTLNNDTFKRGQSEEQINESVSGGGRADDLFGVSQDFSNSNQYEDEEEKQEEINLDKYIYKLPWSINLAYSLTYNNSRGQNDFSTNSLMISSNLSLTPKWKVGVSSGYDFKQKGFTYTQLRFDRDLDSWRLKYIERGLNIDKRKGKKVLKKELLTVLKNIHKYYASQHWISCLFRYTILFVQEVSRRSVL